MRQKPSGLIKIKTATRVTVPLSVSFVRKLNYFSIFPYQFSEEKPENRSAKEVVAFSTGGSS